MAIIKAINSKASIKTAINYITEKEKTEDKLIGGYNCRSTNALEEMIMTKKLWNKTGGRQYKHFVQSFSPNEDITCEEAHKIAAELVESWDKFKGYEVCYATHNDRNHIHTHIIVNSVSFEDGKKFCYSKNDLQNFKNLSDKILQKYDKSICKKNTEITTYDIGEYKALEKAIAGKYDSWILKIVLEVNTAKQKAKSVDEFINLLEQKGIKTEWKENRKYITFKDKDNNKVRDKRLTEIFKIRIDKEALMFEFRANTEREQWQFGGIESEVRNRQAERISAEFERRKSAVSQKSYAGRNTGETKPQIGTGERSTQENKSRTKTENNEIKRQFEL